MGNKRTTLIDADMQRVFSLLLQFVSAVYSFISVPRSLQRTGDKRQEVPAILRGGWELDESREGEESVQQGVISHFVNATACCYVEAFFFFFSIRKKCDRETERSKRKWEPLSCPALCPLRVLSLSAAHTHWEAELWSKSRLDQSSPSSGC